MHAATLEALGLSIFWRGREDDVGCELAYARKRFARTRRRSLGPSRGLNHADARQNSRKIAETYVKLAERLEQRARDEDEV
jgi:hypothetical protein